MGYKINIQKSVSFLYTKNELSERTVWPGGKSLPFRCQQQSRHNNRRVYTLQLHLECPTWVTGQAVPLTTQVISTKATLPSPEDTAALPNTKRKGDQRAGKERKEVSRLPADSLLELRFQIQKVGSQGPPTRDLMGEA